MNKEISLFDFKNARIRILKDENGDPWFVAKDVCDALKIANSRQVVQSLDDDEKDMYNVYTPGGKQDMHIISESGLYSVILRSRKPEVKAFKQWIMHEVLPSIRKTGKYSLNQKFESNDAKTVAMIQAFKGIIQDDYLESKARIVLARQMGELPELESGSRPLYVQDYLKSKGLKGKEIKSKSNSFGKRLKALYIAEHGESPKTAPQEVHGRIIDVNAYTEKDRKLMDKIFNLMFGDEK